MSQQEHILVVDDEAELAETVAFNLRQDGYSVDVALTGAQALERLGASPPPALVILDLMLPDMSGTEVCPATELELSIRQGQRIVHPPRVVLVGVSRVRAISEPLPGALFRETSRNRVGI